MSVPGGPPNPWSREGQAYQWSDPGQYQPPPLYQPPLPPVPPPRRRRTGLWVGFGVLMAIVLGAAIWGAVAETSSESPPASPPAAGAQQTALSGGQTVVVTATDRKSQVTVPASWKDVPKSFKSDVAAIQLGDLGREQYLLVITLDRNDFEDFPAFTGAMLDGARSALDGAEVGEQRNLTIGGLAAVQYEITGRANGLKIVFWYTMVDGKNAYYQVVGWTLPSKRAEAAPVIMDVINSFRELGPA